MAGLNVIGRPRATRNAAPQPPGGTGRLPTTGAAVNIATLRVHRFAGRGPGIAGPRRPTRLPQGYLFEIAAALTVLLVVATLLPLSGSEAWWVRGLDFPRLQLSALALLLAVGVLLLLDSTDAGVRAMLAGLAACLAYHAWWIAPYTPLHRPEVAMAERVEPNRRLRILAVNVLTPNRDADALLARVAATRPDVVIAVETDGWWEERLDSLEPEYRFAIKCPLENLYGMHLYSRLPLEDGRIQYLVEPDVPSIHTVVRLRSGERVRLHCLHPAPPSPTENPESSERDAELVVVGRNVAEADLPVIVAGDLNDVAWSATTRLFRKISGLLDPRVGRGMFNSFHARIPVVRWPLDHLFHSGHWRLVEIRRLGRVGSDHFPILVELQLADGEPSDSSVRPDAEDHETADEKARDEGVDEDEVHTPGE